MNGLVGRRRMLLRSRSLVSSLARQPWKATRSPLRRDVDVLHRREMSSFRFWGDDNGTLELAIGGSLLVLFGVDRLFSYFHHQRFEMDREQLQKEAYDFNAFSKDELKQYRSMPAQERATVTEVVANLDGIKCLRNMKRGDTVEVLEFNVGPGEAYHLCRMRRTTETQIGWFPKACLAPKGD